MLPLEVELATVKQLAIGDEVKHGFTNVPFHFS